MLHNYTLILVCQGVITDFFFSSSSALLLQVETQLTPLASPNPPSSKLLPASKRPNPNTTQKQYVSYLCIINTTPNNTMAH